MDRVGIILAAGKGSRMCSKDLTQSKVVYPILGKPLVSYIVDAVFEAGVDEVITVVGFAGEATKAAAEPKSKVVFQKDLLGTGDALKQVKDLLKNKKGITLVAYGDMPLITSKTLHNLIKLHEKQGNSLTFITAMLPDSTGYGRVIREYKTNRVLAIREDADCSSLEKDICEINAGFYVFDTQTLLKHVDEIKNDNSQHEYYLTDIVEIFVKHNLKIGTQIMRNNEEMFGVNDRVQLAFAAKVIKNRINEKLMFSGVSIEDPDSTYISPDVKIGKDTIIAPNTTICGKCVIGEHNYISQNCYLHNVEIGDNNKILSSYLDETTIGDNNEIGPYTKTRANTIIEDNCRVGNFVELKNAHFHNGVKSAHLTYIGDSDVGDRTNIGCMTVTANYDGFNKSHTTIGRDTFIGSGTIIVAPLTVEEETFTAAGSVITKDVHKDEMAIARAKQENIPHLRSIFLARAKAKKEAKK